MIFKHLFYNCQPESKEIHSIELAKVTCAFKPGDIIRNRYEIARQIIDRDDNGWDETYLAIDRDSTELQQVVIKYLKLNVGRGRSKTAGILFDREMDKLANLSSQIDFIPCFLDRFQDRDEFYLVQEYILGRNMADVLANIRLSELETASLIRSILTRLQAIHTHGVIYSYMKLDSIVLRSIDGKLGFLYCGDISNIVEVKPARTIEQYINYDCYIDRYKSPEVLAKRARFYSDIYSVAAIGIRCLVGRSIDELELCPLTWEIKWRKHCQVSDRFADILNKMYEPNPRYRYNNVAEVLDAIDKVY